MAEKLSTAAADLLVYPIGQLATNVTDGLPIHGAAMHQVRRIKNGAIAITGDRITAAGSADEVLAKIDERSVRQVINAEGKLVTAGLVDPHTHLIFAGNRANEFLMRCQGKTYAEIARSGGGIVASMNATRNAQVDELVELGRIRLERMLAAGTTTCEVKTGYGLDHASELRMLEAIAELSRLQPVELIPTFMPAHAIPPGVDRSVYISQIIDEMLPEVSLKYATAVFPAVFNDVFCDEGYFTLSETRSILEAGLKLGLKAKVHADEFANLGATSLAVELNAASADHLLSVSNHEIDLLAKSNTVATLLPGTSFYLNLTEHAPARKLIDRGAAVALGSDFNPGSCHIFSLPFIWGLSCLHLKMTPEEALTALTVNAAYAIGLGHRIGQVRSGYQADLAIYDLSCLEEVPYNLGWNPVSMTIKRGQLVSNKHHAPERSSKINLRI